MAGTARRDGRAVPVDAARGTVPSEAAGAAGAGAALLDARAWALLAQRIGGAIERARGGASEALAAVTVPVARTLDPTAVALSSRRPGEPWLCLEQPALQRRALAGIGSVRELTASGGDRFERIAAGWRELASGALADAPDGPPGAGLVALGGFAFAPDGARSPAWAGFAPASLIVPELALARRGDDVRLTLAVRATPDDDVAELLARAELRLTELRQAPLGLIDPAPAERVTVSSTMPPEHYESAVARAVERIAAGGLEKIVLAREVEVDAPAGHDPGAVLGALREAFPTCYVAGIGRGDAAFVAATPELLVRRDGLRASTLALAGSAARSADPAVDDHLGERLLRSAKDRSEHEIVVRRIERALRSRALWVAAAPEPVVASIANIQHLATPIRAQLRAPVAAIELAGALHPTPAVGGEPFSVAQPLIPALEGLDRGWYAGPFGWTDSAEDGELCVALRCALLRGRSARCHAGVGVVRGSDPAAELAETELKLQALLPVLGA